MKKIILFTFIVLITIFVLSCKSNTLEGKWQVDPTTLDLVLGEGFPEFMKEGVNEFMKEAKSEDSKTESEKITLELLPDGKGILSHEEEPNDDIEIKWSLNKNILRLYGTIDDEFIDIELEVLEISKNEVLLGLTGEFILKQLREKHPEILEKVPGMFNLDALAKGGRITVKMKRV